MGTYDKQKTVGELFFGERVKLQGAALDEHPALADQVGIVVSRRRWLWFGSHYVVQFKTPKNLWVYAKTEELISVEAN